MILRCAEGDSEAFVGLYDATSSRVFGLALRILRDRAQAEEVAQDAYLDVWQQAARFDPARGSGFGWILTIVHRKAVDRVRSVVASTRRETVHHRETFVHEHDSTSEQVESNVEARRVRAARARLTPHQRHAIDLAYFAGHTHAEVADVLQIPLGTAKSRIRDGLRRLRDELDGTTTSAA